MTATMTIETPTCPHGCRRCAAKEAGKEGMPLTAREFMTLVVNWPAPAPAPDPSPAVAEALAAIDVAEVKEVEAKEMWHAATLRRQNAPRQATKIGANTVGGPISTGRTALEEDEKYAQQDWIDAADVLRDARRRYREVLGAEQEQRRRDERSAELAEREAKIEAENAAEKERRRLSFIRRQKASK